MINRDTPSSAGTWQKCYYDCARVVINEGYSFLVAASRVTPRG